jgi:hypothetical protein
MNEFLRVGIGCLFFEAREEIIFNHERLAWSEIASVVEGDGLCFNDLVALDVVSISVVGIRESSNSYPCYMPLHSVAHHPPLPQRTPVPVFQWVFCLVEYRGVASSIMHTTSSRHNNAALQSTNHGPSDHCSPCVHPRSISQKQKLKLNALYGSKTYGCMTSTACVVCAIAAWDGASV